MHMYIYETNLYSR